MTEWKELLEMTNEAVMGRTENFLGTFPTEESAKAYIVALRQALKSGAKFEGRLGQYASKTIQIRIRARGPRDGNALETPKANATHFDVYIKE